eukprot:1699491-Pleurochrysis_carterae.AAC.1
MLNSSICLWHSRHNLLSVLGNLLLVKKPLCVMSLKWLAKAFASNRVSWYMEGSISQSIVSFVSLLFQALTHEGSLSFLLAPMICHSEPIGNVLLAGPSME